MAPATTAQIPDRLRLPLTFDADLLARDLHALSTAQWIAHFVTQNYDGDWSVIPLRGQTGAQHPVMMIYCDPSTTAYEDTPFLDCCPYFREVLNQFACPLLAVRLMRLTPGSQIKEHTDHELSVEEGTVRIHIPVATNCGVEFYLNGSRIVLEAGSAWYLRLSDPHRVANNGATDRIHMVIDATVNEWMTQLLETAAAQTGRPS